MAKGLRPFIRIAWLAALDVYKRQVVTSVDDGDTTHVTVRVAAEDVERVVGEDGRTAAAMRSVLSASSLETGRRYTLQILGEGFGEDSGVGWVQ